MRTAFHLAGQVDKRDLLVLGKTAVQRLIERFQSRFVLGALILDFARCVLEIELGQGQGQFFGISKNRRCHCNRACQKQERHSARSPAIYVLWGHGASLVVPVQTRLEGKPYSVP